MGSVDTAFRAWTIWKLAHELVPLTNWPIKALQTGLHPPSKKFAHHIHHKQRTTSNHKTVLPSTTAIMPAFDFSPDRPEHIDSILNGLDRYNPETTNVFQDYVAQQCESQTYDAYANLALLKLYV